MKIINNNGHTLDGKGRGAIGFIDESICTRQIGKYFIEGMKALNHTVYDVTIDKSESYLTEAVNKANKYTVDYAITHHLNHFDNAEANGVEVLIYDINDKKTYEVAKRICDEISKLGFRNRGVKESKTLYWLRKNKNKSMIIEYLFCSNRKDVSLYNPQKLANACIYGLTKSYPITTDKLPVINNNPISNTYSNGTYQCKGKVINTNGEGLNIRAERNANSKIIGKLKEGYIVKVDYCLNNWFSVWENGKLGYINGKYIELVK